MELLLTSIKDCKQLVIDSAPSKACQAACTGRRQRPSSKRATEGHQQSLPTSALSLLCCQQSLAQWYDGGSSHIDLTRAAACFARPGVFLQRQHLLGYLAYGSRHATLCMYCKAGEDTSALLLYNQPILGFGWRLAYRASADISSRCSARYGAVLFSACAVRQ